MLELGLIRLAKFLALPAVVALALATTVLAAAAAAPSIAAWSDPISIADTSVSASPALVSVGSEFHLFWLDRPFDNIHGTQGGQVAVFHAVLGISGNILASPRRIATGADSRFGWPVAAATRAGVVVAWMERAGDSVRLMAAGLDATGTMINPPRPLAPPGEESGRISILAVGDRVHIAWSQFDHGQRRVWYLQTTSTGAVDVQARPIVVGDGPTLVSGAPLRLIWWESTGFDTYRLVMGMMNQGVVSAVRPLTGTISLTRIVPVITVPGPAWLDVLIPVVERAFGTAGRLYHLRLDEEGPSQRQQLLPVRSVADVTAVLSDGRLVIAWSEPAGRRRNSEVFAAIFDGRTRGLSAESRVTYTPAGSIRPTLAAAGSESFITWLEVSGVARFRVSFATTTNRRVRFLLGIPELDLDHPGRLLIFSGTVVVSTLPYGALYAMAFALPAAAVAALAGGIFGGFAWWEAVRGRAVSRLALFLLLTLSLQIAGRALIPGEPASRTLITALVLPLAIAFVAARRGALRQGVAFWTTVGVILFSQLLIVLFPWGARQLSQL